MSDGDDFDEQLEKIFNDPECMNCIRRAITGLKKNIWNINWEGFRRVLKLVAKTIAVIVVGVTIVTVAIIFINWLLSFPIVYTTISVILLKVQTFFAQAWLFYMENRVLINKSFSVMIETV